MKGPALFILIVIVILVGAVGGYVFGTHKFPRVNTSFLTPATKTSTTPTAKAVSPTNASPSAAISSTQVQAGATATAFYTWYVDCVNHHFQIKSPKSIAEDCPYQTSNYASTQLAGNLANKTNTDPILCASNTPDSVSVASVNNSTSSTATVMVAEMFGSVTRRVRVDLAIVNNSWKVTNITCPGA